MPALTQSLGHGCAANTPLGCATRVYFNQVPTSFFRFVGQLLNKARPSGIGYGFGQHPTGQALDLQVFHYNQVIGVDQLTRHLVVEINPLVSNVLVHPLEFMDSLTPSVTPLVSSGNLPLSTAQFGLSFVVVAGISYRSTIAQDRETLQAHVNTHCLTIGQQGFRDILHTEAGIPMPCFSFDRYGLNLTKYRAVELDLQLPYALDIQPTIVSEFTPVPVGGEGVAVKATTGLESGIPRFFTTLETGEESFEGLVHSTEHVLTSGVVGKVQVSRGSNFLKLVGLVVIVQRLTRYLPGLSSFLEGRVVKAASRSQLVIQGLCLGFGRVKAVLVCLSCHLHRYYKTLVRFLATIYLQKGGSGDSPAS